jgi:hypothetical protein
MGPRETNPLGVPCGVDTPIYQSTKTQSHAEPSVQNYDAKVYYVPLFVLNYGTYH